MTYVVPYHHSFMPLIVHIDEHVAHLYVPSFFCLPILTSMTFHPYDLKVIKP